MAFYESVLIARQDISAPQVDALTDTLTALLEEQGGKVTKKEYWGLRNFAYRIKKGRKGHYVLLNIDASAPAVHEMERQMRLNEDVVRYLTIRVEELQEGPSVMMQKGDRDRDRGRRDRDDRPRGGGRGRDDGERSESPSPAPSQTEEPTNTGEST